MPHAYLPFMWICTPADALVVVDVVLSSA